MSRPATPEVLEIGQMHFEGNIIPTTWFKNIRFENGKADLVSINLLSEIVYWYRPTNVRDESTGQLKQVKRKFAGTALQKSKKDLAEQFGLSERQVKESLGRLEELGLIKREFRTIQTEFGPIGNVQFILIVPQKIKEITFDVPPYDFQTSEGGTEKDPYDFQTSEGGTFERQPHIYNTETTPETTASSLGGAKAPEENFSSSSKVSDEVKDIYRTMLSLMQSIKADYKVSAKDEVQIYTFIDYMIRIDKRNSTTILDVFRWTVFDAFWSAKLFKPNPAKYLREKFDQLEMNMRANANAKPSQSANYPKSAFESGVGEPKEPRFRAQRVIEG